MPQINPDPHRAGYRFLPSRCVTALFETSVCDTHVVPQLKAAGFSAADIRVYSGPEGAEQIDVDAEKQSTPTRLLQSLVMALADDASYLENAAARLREGGELISVSVGEDEQRARHAGEILKQAGGGLVQHWGDWTTEQF